MGTVYLAVRPRRGLHSQRMADSKPRCRRRACVCGVRAVLRGASVLEWGSLPSLFLLLSGVFAPARQQQLPLHRPQSTQLPHPLSFLRGGYGVVFAFKPKNHLPSEWALLFLLFPPPPTPFPTASPSVVQPSPRGRSQPALSPPPPPLGSAPRLPSKGEGQE